MSATPKLTPTENAAGAHWLRCLVRWSWFACFLGNYEWYRKLYGGLWAHVHVEEPCYSCMWLNCPAGADESYREGNWRGTPEFRNYDPANKKDADNHEQRRGRLA